MQLLTKPWRFTLCKHWSHVGTQCCGHSLCHTIHHCHQLHLWTLHCHHLAHCIAFTWLSVLWPCTTFWSSLYSLTSLTVLLWVTTSLCGLPTTPLWKAVTSVFGEILDTHSHCAAHTQSWAAAATNIWHRFSLILLKEWALASSYTYTHIRASSIGLIFPPHQEEGLHGLVGQLTFRHWMDAAKNLMVWHLMPAGIVTIVGQKVTAEDKPKAECEICVCKQCWLSCFSDNGQGNSDHSKCVGYVNCADEDGLPCDWVPWKVNFHSWCLCVFLHCSSLTSPMIVCWSHICCHCSINCACCLQQRMMRWVSKLNSTAGDSQSTQQIFLCSHKCS